MTRDAESHAEDDKTKKQLAEARNEADTLVYTVEKSLKEYGDKLSESEKTEIQTALEKCKSLKDTSNEASEIKSAVENLTKASHKLAEHIYKTGAQAEAGAGADASTRAGGADAEAGAKGQEEEVVEAEFEEVDKDKKEGSS
jgi:molecular chaperone DnaK